MKLAGVARFDCIGSTQEFTCYMAGLASPRRSHLRLDDQHAAQSPCLAILVPLGMWRLIDNKRHRGSGGWPHPLPAFYRPRSRSAAPDPSRYTRSVAVHPIRRGAMPTDRVHRLPQQAQMRAFPSDIPNRQHRTQPHSCKMLARLRTRGATPVRERYTTPSWCNTTKQHAQSRALPPDTPQPAASDAATRPRNNRTDSVQEPLHPLRRATPVTSRYTRSEGVQCLRIGCTASHNKPNRGQFLPTDPNRLHRTPPHGLDMLTPAPNERRCTS